MNNEEQTARTMALKLAGKLDADEAQFERVVAERDALEKELTILSREYASQSVKYNEVIQERDEARHAADEWRKQLSAMQTRAETLTIDNEQHVETIERMNKDYSSILETNRLLSKQVDYFRTEMQNARAYAEREGRHTVEAYKTLTETQALVATLAKSIEKFREYKGLVDALLQADRDVQVYEERVRRFTLPNVDLRGLDAPFNPKRNEC